MKPDEKATGDAFQEGSWADTATNLVAPGSREWWLSCEGSNKSRQARGRARARKGSASMITHSASLVLAVGVSPAVLSPPSASSTAAQSPLRGAAGRPLPRGGEVTEAAALGAAALAGSGGRPRQDVQCRPGIQRCVPAKLMQR